MSLLKLSAVLAYPAGQHAKARCHKTDLANRKGGLPPLAEFHLKFMIHCRAADGVTVKSRQASEYIVRAVQPERLALRLRGGWP